MMNPKVSVVIGSYNRYSFLKLTIDTVRGELVQYPHEIIVVDGGSTDRSLSWLIKQKDIISIVQHNRGTWKGEPIERKSWGYFMNLGFKCASGKYICMLSDDSLVNPGAIHNGINQFEKMLADGKKLGALAFYWREWPLETNYKVKYSPGKRIFVNHGLYLKAALEDVNYIDEVNYHFYHADTDLCLKLWKRGYEVTDANNSFVEHYAHANMAVRRTNLTRQSQDWNKFLEVWGNWAYDAQKDNYGGDLIKEHEVQTANRFKNRNYYTSRVRRKLLGLVNKFIS